MKRCGLFGLVVAAVVCTTGTAQAVGLFTIDTFDTPQALSVNGPANTASSSVSGVGIIGGHRDMEVNSTAGIPFLTWDADASVSIPGKFNISAGPTIAGNTLLQWDGGDGSISLDPTGLGGIDITNGGLNTAIGIRVSSSDLASNFTLTVYDASDNTGSTFSTANLAVPSGIFSDTDFLVNFTDFVGGADLTNVGAIELLVDGAVPGLDLIFDFIQSGSTLIPEPFSAATWLVCLTVAGLVIGRKRRLAAKA